MSTSWRQPPALPATFFATLPYVVLLQARLAAAGSDLDGGQITGVVLGSIGGALLLVLVTCLTCYLCANRRRQTGDLTWAKTADLEAVAVGADGHTLHEPLPGAPSSSTSAASPTPGSAGQPGGFGSAASHHHRPSAISAVGLGGPSAARSPDGGPRSPTDFPSASMEAGPASPSDGVDYRQMSSRGRSTGSGFAAFSRSILRGGSNVKDKNLEVSRSARVEPSAEVEMTEPFEPATTNMGPPLSKSSMLLRWLNGADDGHAEAVAAQLAAAAAAAAGENGGAKGAGGGVRSGRALGGTGGQSSPFSDRLPLLSLAAQQSGIVWNKMPPSVASSPAVSVAESSSMHMLRRTWKRSDAPDEAALNAALASANTSGGNGSASWLLGGDDRYPPSLAMASVEALRRRSSLQGDRPGIVFDYVSSTPNNSRAPTAGGAPSRVPTIGGAVLPLPPTAGAAAPVDFGAARSGGGSSSMGGGAEVATHGSAGSSAGGAPPPSSGAPAGAGALWGHLPDDNIFAQVLAQQQRIQHLPPGPEISRSSGVWLHQAAPTKLAALREADSEGEEAADDEELAARAPPPSALRPAAEAASRGAALAPSGMDLLKPEQYWQQQQPVVQGPGHAPPGLAAAAAPGGPAPDGTTGSTDAAPPPLSVRTDWTHFSEGGGWSTQRSTISGDGTLAHVGRGVAAIDDTCVSPDTCSIPLSSSGQDALTPPMGASQATSPLSPFLPRPPGESEDSDPAPPAAPALATEAAGQTARSESSPVTEAAAATARQGGAYGGMTGLHHVALRANSAISASTAAGDEAAKGPAVEAFRGAATAATGATSERVMPAGPPPSAKRRVPPPVLPPSQSTKSLQSVKSMNSSISPSMSVHFPEVSPAWTATAAAAFGEPGSLAGSHRGSTAGQPALGPGDAAGSVFVLPVSTSSKTTL